MKDITAVILAGGRGTRLRQVVADRPKVLADVGGRPFLAYLLDDLAAQGLQRVVLGTGYMAECVQKTLGDSFRNLALVYSHEAQPLGTGGALRLALPHIASEDVLVLNGDSYCAADLGALVRSHRSAPAAPAATLVVVQVPDTGRFGRIRFDEDRRIASFDEKGTSAGAGWINAGIYLMARRRIEEIPAGRAVSLERELFPAWVGRGLYVWPSPGPFIDIGDPDSYRQAAPFFAARKPGRSPEEYRP